MEQNGGLTEEEKILTIRNLSNQTATIRCLLKKHPCFTIYVDEVLNRSAGVRFITQESTGSRKLKRLLQFDALGIIRYRIVFRALDLKEVHLSLDFLINEKDLVRVQLHASGCKSKVIQSSSPAVIDLGCVEPSFCAVERAILTNRSPRNIQVTCVRKPDDQVEILPRCFILPATDKVELLIRFNPNEEIKAFTDHVKAVFSGGEGTLAIVKGRAAFPPPSVIDITTGADVKTTLFPILSDIESAISEAITEGSKLIAEGKVLEGVNRLIGNETKVEPENEESLKIPPTFRLFNEKMATRFIYRGLRPLEDFETPCPSDMLDSMLENVGWRFAANMGTCW